MVQVRAAFDDRRNVILRISFHCRERSSMTAESRKKREREREREREVVGLRILPFGSGYTDC